MRLESEDREHRMRPEDAAAREVPVPQAAAAAVERGVDAGAHGLVDDVGFARARRLPVEGEAEDQHDEAGGGRERDGQRRVGAPAASASARRCTIATWPCPELSQCTVAKAGVPSARAISSTPATAPKVSSGCDGPRMSIRRRPSAVLSGCADGGASRRRRSGRRSAPPRRSRRPHWSGRSAGRAPAPSRDDLLELGLLAAVVRPLTARPSRSARNSALPAHAAHDLADRLAAMVEDLHERADADRDQERDDERRHRAPQRRLRRQKTPIRRLGDRLRQTFDGIGY